MAILVQEGTVDEPFSPGDPFPRVKLSVEGLSRQRQDHVCGIDQSVEQTDRRV